jgi:hypothetical protein
VEGVWRDLNEGRFTEVTTQSGVSLSFFLIPTRNAEVRVNGRLAPGSVFAPGFPQAFLALSETWRK